MRVTYYLADQNPQRDRSLGITQMTDTLLNELRARPDLQMRTITSRSSYALAGDIHNYQIPIRTDRQLARLLADNTHPLWHRDDSDIWHYPKGYLSLIARPRCATVGTIHDMILPYYARHYPRYRSRFDYAYWIALIKSSLQKFDLVIAVSEFARKQVNEFCDEHHLRIPPIVVTYEASTVALSSSMATKTDSVIHLASDAPHKQTATLLEMWAQLQSRRELPELVLVGFLDDASTRLAKGMRNVRVLPRQPRAQLEQLIASARALLLPSEIEGFGLPAIEAYALGTTVCYVRDTVFDEIMCDGGAGAFELRDVDALDAALQRITALDAAQIHHISTQLAERFSVKNFADRTLEAYRAVLK